MWYDPISVVKLPNGQAFADVVFKLPTKRIAQKPVPSYTIKRKVPNTAEHSFGAVEDLCKKGTVELFVEVKHVWRREDEKKKAGISFEIEQVNVEGLDDLDSEQQ